LVCCKLQQECAAPAHTLWAPCDQARCLLAGQALLVAWRVTPLLALPHACSRPGRACARLGTPCAARAPAAPRPQVQPAHRRGLGLLLGRAGRLHRHAQLQPGQARGQPGGRAQAARRADAARRLHAGRPPGRAGDRKQAVQGTCALLPWAAGARDAARSALAARRSVCAGVAAYRGPACGGAASLQGAARAARPVLRPPVTLPRGRDRWA